MAFGYENGKTKSGTAPYALESHAASSQPNKVSLKLHSSYTQFNKLVKNNNYRYIPGIAEKTLSEKPESS